MRVKLIVISMQQHMFWGVIFWLVWQVGDDCVTKLINTVA